MQYLGGKSKISKDIAKIINDEIGGNKSVRTFCGVSNAEFYNLDYRAVPIPDNAVIYCDPPYKGTAGYSTGTFDSDAFWDYVRSLSSTYKVFVSEESAPKDFGMYMGKKGYQNY